MNDHYLSIPLLAHNTRKVQYVSLSPSCAVSAFKVKVV
ncbi:hypothetical protein AKJ08_3490 [Vulgatibacter incomptus]|uniref:Uncharacterized protein n=1 Tax=Vulgatibacter incomptus TaxID=1391653 RepID=A0A0K1PHT7_9BACT|nr:hypothetical protein AKJ08_3490 [Vulgatibacter incomptus]